ncbi:MAG: SRPBCC domain-containing protein [Bacteroidia bacterium]
MIQLFVDLQLPAAQAWRSFTQPAHIINWNFAHESWHCPTAENNLQAGGHFKYHMAARDGSGSFDFEGQFEQIEHRQRIAYHLNDSRKVEFRIEPTDSGIRVWHNFEAATDHDAEQQRQGWQAILDQFALYTASLEPLVEMHFEHDYPIAPEELCNMMFSDKGYREWTKPFNANSHFEGVWETGASMRFLGVDGDGTVGGMLSKIRLFEAGKQVCIVHEGDIQKGQEVRFDQSVAQWAGAEENYYFEPMEGGTRLRVMAEVAPQFESWMQEFWPPALQKLHQMCEKAS